MAKAAVEEMDPDEGAMFEDEGAGLVIDLSGVEALSFEALPKGTYNVIIEEVEYGLSKSSNKPMWNLKLAVLDQQYENRKLFTFLSFSEKALPGTKTTMSVIAPELLDTPFRPDDADVFTSLVGKKCAVRVSIEKYEERDQNRIKSWLPVGDEGGDDFIE